MFALMVRFDLIDEQAAALFDELVEKTGELIRTSEPGTLLYAVNEVNDAPLARVFYEVYTDRSAFDAHERGDHVRTFLSQREQYIANVRVEFLTPTGGKNLP